ncbi:MAG TPA: alpha/beta fold hydrolase [Actinomycetes bacterium]
MPTVEVNGTTLWYEAFGDGPTCLVMHGGLGLDHALCRPVVERLAGRLRLVWYDHRGNGRSGRPPLETLTMEQLADDADALARRLGAGPVLVLGWSYGGFVAQELAVRHPARVAGLVLVGTTPGQLGATERPGGEQGPPPPAELAGLTGRPPAVGDEEFAAVMRGFVAYMVHRADPAELTAALDRTVLDAAAWRRSMEVLAGWSVVDRLGQVRVPTLVLAGRHDFLAAPPQAERIASRIPGAERVVFDHSGHALTYDEPDRFLAVVGDWLARHARDRQTMDTAVS